ncbi:unnamed protein product [Cercopithifilaria johnstoni]|uniref:G-protein coupled receptors family 1 profile domain-containing protein n=1 Tax=Cercopithifilaria johnstoni TaxID=2874296 RepID=A0A8J2LTY0_9BILA|nr:unnamed protein product [Cercopithifilaria johnstoni]
MLIFPHTIQIYPGDSIRQISDADVFLGSRRINRNVSFRFMAEKVITKGVNNRSKQDQMLPVINYILHTYAYFIIGPMAAAFNIPVFLFVIMRKTLRGTYIVIAVVFLNSGFSGIGVTLLGIKRLSHFHDEKLISNKQCVLSVPIILPLAVLCVNGISLLMNSAERLSVVAFPVYYYIHNARINYSLIAAQYVITVIAVIITATASLIEPTRQISNLCILQDVYSPYFYKAILLMVCSASSMSVVLMIIVVIILRKKFGAQFLSNNSYNRDLSHFLNNQRRFTKTAIISGCLTFFLVVIPSIVEYIYMMDSSETSKIIVICCAHLRLLNSFNMVVLFLYRQKDFRYDAVQCFNFLIYKRKTSVQPMY